jgi:hypothetical protein
MRVTSWLSITTVLTCAMAAAAAQEGQKNLYPARAPIEQYRITDRSEEIALARTAAPASISGDADVLVLGEHGYETAVKGNNGFVCLVERAWFGSFKDPEFWNPKNRSPNCLNAAAASTVLPVDLEKTQWALAGLSVADMVTRTKSSTIAHQAPAPGAMAYMMSKQGRLNDAAGHWHPHLMFFLPHSALSDWGANLPGSPVLGQEGGANQATVYYVPVSKWSDGSSAIE